MKPLHTIYCVATSRIQTETGRDVDVVTIVTIHLYYAKIYSIMKKNLRSMDVVMKEATIHMGSFI